MWIECGAGTRGKSSVRRSGKVERTSGLAIAAALALAPVDYAIVAAAFLYRPLGGELVLAVVAAVFLLGVGFRRRALIYASQSVAIAPALIRVVERPQDLGVVGVVLVGAAAAGVAALAWLVARALSSPG